MRQEHSTHAAQHEATWGRSSTIYHRLLRTATTIPFFGFFIISVSSVSDSGNATCWTCRLHTAKKAVLYFYFYLYFLMHNETQGSGFCEARRKRHRDQCTWSCTGRSTAKSKLGRFTSEGKVRMQRGEYMRNSFPHLYLMRSDILIIKSDILSLKSDIPSLKSDIPNLKSDIPSLKSDTQRASFVTCP